MFENPRHDFVFNAKLILFAVFTVVFLLALYFFRWTFLVSLIGIGLGVLASPILSFLHRKYKFPRALSALFCIIALIILVGGLGYGIWLLVADQLDNLWQRAPEIWSNLQERFSSFLSRYPWLQKEIEGMNIGGTAQDVAAKFLAGLKTSVTGIAGLLLAFVIAVYAAVSLDDYFESLVNAFPARKRERAAHLLSKSASTLRIWFRAQLIDMVILGLISAIGLWIVGVNYWAVYGLLAAVLGIIPYIGAFLTVAVASLITLTSDPSLVPWVIVVFFVAQQIEGNIVLPLVMRGQIELPEVPLLIFMLFLGSWLGIVGVFIAPPLLAIFRNLYIEIYLPKMDRR